MESPAPTTDPAWLSSASDLSKLCLPQEYKDSNRRLAWVNSICCLFLLIGAVGFRPPGVHVRPLSEVNEIIPPVPDVPDATPPPKTEQPPDSQPADSTPLDSPRVATVVAFEPSSVAFAVAVEGPVVKVRGPFVPPPPPILKRPFNAGPPLLQSSDEDWGGSSPQPDYPGMAQRNGYQGTATLEIIFDPAGAVQSVKVLKSSGYNILDNAAMEKVRKNLRLRVPSGEVRVCIKDFVFRMPR